jgi:hypothetical protein
MTKREREATNMNHRNLLKAAICCCLIAATALAQVPATQTDKAPPVPQAPQVCPANAACSPTVAKQKLKHHRTRTILIVAAVALATAALVVVERHKNTAAQHCNGPNPLTCAP